MKPAGTLVVVVLALVTGFFFGRWFERSASTPSTSAMASAPMMDSVPGKAPMMPTAEAAAEPSGGLSGEVLELIQVPKYTYFRLATPGGEEWAAVGSTTEVKTGDTVTIADAVPMQNFSSPTLNRTFASIYFGNLGASKAAAAPSMAAPSGGASPFPMMGGTAPAMGGAAEASPHGSATPPTDPGPGARVERARGDTAKTVSELFAQRQTLVGKTVKLHARVTKVVTVQGVTYVHLRDGSGEVGKEDFDLMATTKASPTVNSVVTMQGPVAVDKDVGIGKIYPVILDQAQVVEN